MLDANQKSLIDSPSFPYARAAVSSSLSLVEHLCRVVPNVRSRACVSEACCTVSPQPVR
jgi:hypothetical protein